tara:strand:- start:1436 stop:1735 length:300 start_codon:yes stop_codon:yes gene_type:complete
MKTYKKLFLFFVCNALGFNIGPVIYVLSLKFDWVNSQAIAEAGGNLESALIFGPSVTWLVCALFSFAIFFVRKSWRTIFLLAPIFVPLIHALVMLVKVM